MGRELHFVFARRSVRDERGASFREFDGREGTVGRISSKESRMAIGALFLSAAILD